MAAVAKAGGKYYYENDRIWREAAQIGIAPFFVGKWGGRIAVPQAPTKDFVRDACQGTKYLPRVQKNRVGCYDLTFTFSKSVSIYLHGLTPRSRWAAKSSRLLVDATRPEVERLVANQRANGSAQGKTKVASQGGAIGFVNWESSRKVVHSHVHYCVPNLTATKAGKVKSIANAREMFLDQGVMRARANKRLDDMLQDRGVVTKREGKTVAIAGIPDKMVERLSPSRQAMNLAARKMGFTSPRAQAFYARHARNAAGVRTLGDPDAMNRACRKMARKFGVTARSLERPAGTPPPHRNIYEAASVAYDVAKAAVGDLAKKHGTFTAEQFLERVYTRGIGKSTTLDELEKYAGIALGNPKFMGVQKQPQPDGTVRYSGPASKASHQQAAGQYQSATQEAWKALKDAANGLGKAVLIKTTSELAGVLNRLKEAVNPEAKRLTVHASHLGHFVQQHRPTGRIKAHAKALIAGLRARGNPHERAFAAEKTYAALRAHSRIPKNTLLVVERAAAASNSDLIHLAKVARRDGVTVILSEFGRHGPGLGRNKSNSRHQQQQRNRNGTP